MCDLCGGTFESRGLRLCPDCYEIRKQEPGFDDDKRWSSAAGKVAFEHRLCLWCGAPTKAERAPDPATIATPKTRFSRVEDGLKYGLIALAKN